MNSFFYICFETIWSEAKLKNINVYSIRDAATFFKDF